MNKPFIFIGQFISVFILLVVLLFALLFIGEKIFVKTLNLSCEGKLSYFNDNYEDYHKEEKKLTSVKITLHSYPFMKDFAEIDSEFGYFYNSNDQTIHVNVSNEFINASIFRNNGSYNSFNFDRVTRSLKTNQGYDIESDTRVKPIKNPFSSEFYGICNVVKPI